jgi:hypothetical protein
VTPTYHLYADDSGSRDLDKSDEQVGSKWFALGGVLVAEEDEDQVRLAHADFCTRWEISHPLHSYDIRNAVADFTWVKGLSAEKKVEFFDDLSGFLVGLPVLGSACVVHRQGYNDRYRAKYGTRRWALCKTAFTIVIERAAKFAHQNGRRLKVFYERSDRINEGRLEGYYAAMRAEGMPFNGDTSSKYTPLTAEELRRTLWECRKKFKSSPIMQVADLYLHPICVGGYEADNRALVALRANKRTINCVLSEDEAPHIGIKYSCFDFKNVRGEDFSSPLPAESDLVGSARST